MKKEAIDEILQIDEIEYGNLEFVAGYNDSGTPYGIMRAELDVRKIEK